MITCWWPTKTIAKMRLSVRFKKVEKKMIKKPGIVVGVPDRPALKYQET